MALSIEVLVEPIPACARSSLPSTTTVPSVSASTPPGMAPASRRSNRCVKACGGISAPSARTSPASWPSATTTAVSTCPTSSRPRCASLASRACLPPGARGQRIRGTLHPDAEGEPAVGPHPRHRRGPQAGAARVPRHLQHQLAHPAPRIPLTGLGQTGSAFSRRDRRVGCSKMSHQPRAVQHRWRGVSSTSALASDVFPLV